MLATQPRPDRVVIAGVPTIWFHSKLGVENQRPICLGDHFSSEAALFQFLRTVETDPAFGPAAVYPFSVVAYGLLVAEKIPMSAIYVGGRAGRFYFSDKHPRYTQKVQVYSGGDHLSVFGSASFDSAKLSAFVTALPADCTEIEVTAGHTVEARQTIATTLNGVVKGRSFVPVHPEREAYRIWECINDVNNVLDRGFGTLPCDSDDAAVVLPQTFLGVALGRSTAHVFGWSSADIPQIMTTRTLQPRYVAVKIPRTPSVLKLHLYTTSPEDAQPEVIEEATALSDAVLRMATAV